MASKRTVLIGAGRRITIDELLAVAVHGTASFELFVPKGEEVKEESSLPSVVDLSVGLAAISRKGDEGLMNEPESVASLALVALAVAQGRILPKGSDCDGLCAVLVGVLQAADASEQDFRLSFEASDYLQEIKELVPPCYADLIGQLSKSFVQRMNHCAIGALAAGRARQLSQMANPIAALSAERVDGVDASAFSDLYYDILRPHRESATSATIMRAVLNGSQYVPLTPRVGLKYAADGCSDEACAVMDAPQQNGPAREAIKSACKVIELELNCSEPDGKSKYDESVFKISVENTKTAVKTLLGGCLARRGVKPNDVSIPQNDIYISIQSLVTSLKSNLESEAVECIDFIKTEVVRAEEAAKKKEAEKAAKAAAFQNRNEDGNSKPDEFAGMSEEKKAKILKKRAEKEAKARAKAAAKEKKKVTLFGSGTLPISNALSKGCEVSPTSVDLNESVVNEVNSIVEKLLSGGIQRKPKIAKGTRDYLPEQMMIRDQAFQIIRRVFKRHGAVEIDTPVFELKDTLTGKYGEDSKLIYDLADQGGEMLALRYDLTVPFARFIALNSVGNIKRFHIGKVYRRDQPVLSKGRYREFYQCDFDIAGNYGRMVPDSECVAVATEILASLPIGDFAIKLNHRRLLDAILDICGVESDKFRTICSAVDKLDKEPWEAVKAEMIDKGLKGDVADKIGKFVLQKGEPWHMYKSLMDSKAFGNHKAANEAMEDLRIMFEYLEAMEKLKYVSFDLSLARGLDYYTGVIYEAVCLSGKTQVGSIGGGGRYDNLVSMFQEAGKQTPCVGVSVGIERVFTLMEARLREQQGGSIKQPNVAVLVASVGNNMMSDRMRVTQRLWNANISAEFSQQENPKLKYELANALDRGIPFMVIVGEDEIKIASCKVKDLKARTEELVTLDNLSTYLLEKGVVPVGCEFAAEEEKNRKTLRLS